MKNKYIICILCVILVIGTIGCVEEEKKNETKNDQKEDKNQNDVNDNLSQSEFKKEQLIGIWELSKDETGAIDPNKTGARYVFFSNNEFKNKYYNVSSQDFTRMWGEYKIEEEKLNITLSGTGFLPSLYNFTIKDNNETLILKHDNGNIKFYKTNSSTDSEKKINHSNYEEEDLIGVWKINSVYSPLFESSYFEDYNSTWYFYNNGTLRDFSNHPSFNVENTTNWYNYSFTKDGDLIKEFIKGDTHHSQKIQEIDFEFSDNKDKFTIYSLVAYTYEKIN